MTAAINPHVSQSPPTPAAHAEDVGGTVFEMARDWLAALGDVPLERIRFNPLPGAATEEDALRITEAQRPCELVNGTLVETASSWYEGLIGTRIAFLLTLYLQTHPIGVVNGEGGLVRLIRRQARIPDVAFYFWSRFPERHLPRGGVPALVPDLAVEVLSDGNTRREMEIKLAEYFEACTRLVWYVDPPTRTIAVYTSPVESRTLTAADRLTGGDVLAGFDVAVADLFDVQ